LRYTYHYHTPLRAPHYPPLPHLPRPYVPHAHTHRTHVPTLRTTPHTGYVYRLLGVRCRCALLLFGVLVVRCVRYAHPTVCPTHVCPTHRTYHTTAHVPLFGELPHHYLLLFLLLLLFCTWCVLPVVVDVVTHTHVVRLPARYPLRVRWVRWWSFHTTRLFPFSALLLRCVPHCPHTPPPPPHTPHATPFLRCCSLRWVGVFVAPPHSSHTPSRFVGGVVTLPPHTYPHYTPLPHVPHYARALVLVTPLLVLLVVVLLPDCPTLGSAAALHSTTSLLHRAPL